MEIEIFGDGDTPPRFLRTPEAGRFLGLSGRTLEKHRTYGTGPQYRKIGGRVVYAVLDLQTWADMGLQSSTSNGRGLLRPAKPISNDRRPSI
jgi:predicted DNA-binding transcriptional regulator AlpA